MIRDLYKQQWQAKRGTWRQLESNLARMAREEESLADWERYMRECWRHHPELAEERIREERAYRAERLAARALAAARDRELSGLLNSLVPVNHWIGAAWVDPKGNLYPVRYCNHCARADEIAPHVYRDEIERIRERDGYVDCGEFLSDRKGWLRIGADGLVGDHNWVRVKDIPTPQFDAIWNMHERGKVKGTHDYKETTGFIRGLWTSLRYALGEVDESGRTPEEVRQEHERYEHMQRRWAREDAEYRARWALEDAERAATAQPIGSVSDW